MQKYCLLSIIFISHLTIDFTNAKGMKASKQLSKRTRIKVLSPRNFERIMEMRGRTKTALQYRKARATGVDRWAA